MTDFSILKLLTDIFNCLGVFVFRFVIKGCFFVVILLQLNIWSICKSILKKFK